ncbi:MAG: hypothetical protein ABFD18_06350 [Syntrophomonas sp.]
MIFEIINPSDKYTLETDDFKTACIAVLILGEGKYSIDQVDGNLNMPIFLFGGHDEWFKAQFGSTVSEVMESITGEYWLKIAECLDSVMIGGPNKRKMYYDALTLIEGEDKKKEWRDKWHDTYRGSMNNIGSRAWALAEVLRK